MEEKNVKKDIFAGMVGQDIEKVMDKIRTSILIDLYENKTVHHNIIKKLLIEDIGKDNLSEKNIVQAKEDAFVKIGKPGDGTITIHQEMFSHVLEQVSEELGMKLVRYEDEDNIAGNMMVLINDNTLENEFPVDMIGIPTKAHNEQERIKNNIAKMIDKTKKADLVICAPSSLFNKYQQAFDTISTDNLVSMKNSRTHQNFDMNFKERLAGNINARLGIFSVNSDKKREDKPFF